MEGQGEAAADVITGGVIARAVEPGAGEAHHKEGHGQCRNCGASLAGAYCSNCGQPAHLHRSLVSLGHDILHGVFHFEGKVWRTIPELCFHPGRLTRRYIDGERARFVSPMALYLFTVFLMFAVFSFVSGPTFTLPGGATLSPVQDWKTNIEDQIQDVDTKLEAEETKLQAPTLTAEERKKVEEEIATLLASRQAMKAMISGDWRQMVDFERKQAERTAGKASVEVNTGTQWPKPGSKAAIAIEQATNNPALLYYKLKTSGYKYSWALIPLSVPFMWLLFFWRRDIHVYDHAIFVTYSISFMMLFVVVLSLASAAGVPDGIWSTALAIVPPLHLYKQLRGAYGLSRFGAWLRLLILSIMIIFVLVMFSMLLLTLGMVG